MSYTILSGDCVQHMREEIPAGSVHCVVTSPPYWGLRDYGIPGRDWQDGWHGVFGNEPKLEQYIAHTLEVFEGLRRVMRDDGTIWWNLGDSYISNGNKLMMPYRVAIALQDAGWCVRQDVIWAKPSPMPESISGWSWQRCRVKVSKAAIARMGDPAITGERSYMLGGGNTPEAERGLAKWAICPGCSKCDPHDGYVLRRGRWRPTNGHEVILQITKGEDYFSDATAAAEQAVGAAPGNKHHKGATAYSQGDIKMRTKVGLTQMVATETRNPRSVWRISSEAYKGAHFATYPTEIPFRCITASTSQAGCCSACGSPLAPVISKGRKATRPGNDTKVGRVSDKANCPYHSHSGSVVGNRDPQRHISTTEVLEYRPTCDCSAEVVPCTVYDPFGGSGTTAQVAHHMGRHAILSEISGTYRELIAQRIDKRPKCLVIVKAKKTRRKLAKQQRELF